MAGDPTNRPIDGTWVPHIGWVPNPVRECDCYVRRYCNCHILPTKVTVETRPTIGSLNEVKEQANLT